jgi:adenylate cyclase
VTTGGNGSHLDVIDEEELFDGVDGESEQAARRQLLEHLVEVGADDGQLREAAREGRLATLPVEFALKGEPQYTLTQVARKARLDPGYLRSVLLSLEHANPPPRERGFTDEDVETARLLRRFLDAGLQRSDVLDVTRVLGQSIARTAAVIREVVGNALLEPGDTEADLGLRYAHAAAELVPLMGSVLGYELAAHLREQATRDVITRGELESGKRAGTREVAVCFADLSDFTRLGESVPVDRVAAIGGRMAELAAEIANPEVELVKTVGDGALFVSSEVDPLLAAACALHERVHAEGEDFPAVRAGIAFGDAVVRGGDWFGPGVNRASRIVDVAKAGTIVAEEAVKERADERYEWSRRRFKKGLKGVPRRLSLYRLHTSRDDK